MAVQHDRTAPSAAPERELAAALGRDYAAPARVAFVVNNDRSFLSHRCTWAAALAAAGSDVLVMAEDTGLGAAVEAVGFRFRPVRLGRESIGPLRSVRAAATIAAHLVRHRPQVVFLSATAAYTLGWPAALVLRRSVFVRIFAGAGRAFETVSRRSPKGRLLTLLTAVPARLRNVRSLFQIEDDRRRFLALGMAAPATSSVVPGTGVDTATWTPGAGVAADVPVVLFAGRLFREKGVYEFVELAERLRDELPCRFVLAGAPDEGVSTGVTAAEIASWVDRGVLEYWGYRSDMRPVLRDTAVVVMPTRHPEGTPKILIEAAACGVPAVVSDQAGCRAVVEDEVTGFVVPLNDPSELESHVRKLVADRELRARLGSAARRRAVEVFSLESVLPQIMAVAGIAPRPGVGRPPSGA